LIHEGEDNEAVLDGDFIERDSDEERGYEK
jgi:hypothetical protein